MIVFAVQGREEFAAYQVFLYVFGGLAIVVGLAGVGTAVYNERSALTIYLTLVSIMIMAHLIFGGLVNSPVLYERKELAIERWNQWSPDRRDSYQFNRTCCGFVDAPNDAGPACLINGTTPTIDKTCRQALEADIKGNMLWLTTAFFLWTGVDFCLLVAGLFFLWFLAKVKYGWEGTI